MKFTDVAGIMNIPYVAEKVKLSHVAEIVKLSHVAGILEAGSMYDRRVDFFTSKLPMIGMHNQLISLDPKIPWNKKRKFYITQP